MTDSEDRERIRRQQALETLRAVRDQVSERNADLTPEEIEAIADRFSRDVIQGLIDKGKVRFAE